MHKEGVGKAGGMYVGGFCVRVGERGSAAGHLMIYLLQDMI